MTTKKPTTTNALCVDASCIGNPGVMEYRAVDLSTGKEIFHSPLYPRGTNNLGEFLAIYDAIRYIEKLEKTKKTKSPKSSLIKEGDHVVVEDLKRQEPHNEQCHYSCIYSDSMTAIYRMQSKKIKTTLTNTPETKELLEKVQEAVIRLKTHTITIPIYKRETKIRGEIPADFDRK